MSWVKEIIDYLEIVFSSIWNVLYNMGQSILTANWMAIIQALGSIGAFFLGVVAVKGLHTWRVELGHKEKVKILMELVEVMTQLYFKLKEPTKTIKLMEELIEAFAEFEPQGPYGENTGFIRYIEGQGQATTKVLNANLNDISDAISKVQPLMLKAECMGFKEIKKSRTAYLNFIVSENKIHALCQMLNLQNINWDNPRVQDSIASIRRIRSSELDEQLKDDFSLFMEFSKENLNSLFK